ncbi:MAG: NADH-quinone oxidoreductase subunit D, partial [Phycisphaerae bacterium]|nr:NADH-quinone oxidoreductase subunit D [Phycisphaerae bacterium]
MGPQHPSTHGVLRIILRTDGELIINAVPDIGYLHRCAEKIGESVTYIQYTPYTDRMDYLAAMNNNLGYSLAVEKLAGIEAPARAQYIRVIMAELNRIASHLVMFGTYGLDMGAFTPFVYAFRERELILDLFEAVCGARLTYSYITIGGVRDDLPAGWVEKCREFLDYFEPKLKEYNDLLSFNQIFIKRTASVGVIPADRAIAYGLTGPSLRGSGVKWDLRKDTPDLVYDKLDFNVCVGDGRMGALGDSWDR